MKTARVSKPPNGSKVMLTVYGEKGRSKDLELWTEGKKLFEAGNTDEFNISAGDIGEPYKIRIGRMDRDHWEIGWHLDQV